MTATARSQALALWEQGIERQMAKDIEGAIALYQQSLELCPTAEAHTFLGWAKSWRGDIDGAIEECKRAIEVDPDFGNPYNDIGAYLIEKGELDEAVPWLERATLAKRYEPRHFPFLNLGRIRIKQGRVTAAIREFERALAIDPENASALEALAKLRSLN